jgi:alkylated DNA repair dioxygenase AlkB
MQALLEGGDLVLLHGEARFRWLHGIRGVSAEVYHGQPVVRGRRVSVTLRRLCEGVVLGGSRGGR